MEVPPCLTLATATRSTTLLAWPSVAIGFVLAMLAIATAAVTGYFLFEAGLEMMSRF